MKSWYLKNYVFAKMYINFQTELSIPNRTCMRSLYAYEIVYDRSQDLIFQVCPCINQPKSEILIYYFHIATPSVLKMACSHY